MAELERAKTNVAQSRAVDYGVVRRPCHGSTEQTAVLVVAGYQTGIHLAKENLSDRPDIVTGWIAASHGRKGLEQQDG